MVDFPSKLKLSVKREFVDVSRGSMVGNKLVGKVHSALNSPA